MILRQSQLTLTNSVKKIIEGTVYDHIYKEQMDNKKLAENIFNNSIDIGICADNK